MLDHMIFAHEMDDGFEINSIHMNYRIEHRDKFNSNSNDNNWLLIDDRKLTEIEKNCNRSNDTTPITEMFKNNTDTTMSNCNMEEEVVFDTSDENIKMLGAVECRLDFDDHDEDIAEEISMTPSKSSEKSNSDIASNAGDICEYNSDEHNNGGKLLKAMSAESPDIFKVSKKSLI